MVFDFYTKKIKVFVSEVSDDISELKENLLLVLKRAGMEVLYLDLSKLNGNQELIDENNRLLNMADCSIHILGNQSAKVSTDEGDISLIVFQLKEAQNRKNSEWRDFKIFIWHPAFIADNMEGAEIEGFISSIRQGIIHNMIYSGRDTAISFVEDIRSVMFGGKEVKMDTDNTDIFFIYNGIDQEAANDILTLVADVAQVKLLEISLSEDIDYSELVAQQIEKSKLVVVYYRITSDWAVPFVQQVWKRVGGASSKVPILFIGDANIPVNENIEFDAPMVISQIIAKEIIPIEIKVQFDKLSE